jgi:hypothetical protein
MLPAVDTFSSGLAGFPTEFRSRYRHAAVLATLKRRGELNSLFASLGTTHTGRGREARLRRRRPATGQIEE